MDKIASIIRSDAESIISRVDLSPLAGKFVVVTGATGLIGTYVLACLDTFGKCKTVVRVASKEPPMDHPSQHFCKKWIWIARDLSQPANLCCFPDYIFYGAGYGQPAKFTADPLTTLGINTTGLASTLTTLQDGGRAIYMSSSEIYSGCNHPPFHEGDIGTTTPQHPRGCYIEAKRAGEAILAAFKKEKPRSHFVSARVALAYGPGTKKDDGRALNQFVKQAIVERKIALMDSGQVLRTYCYVSDTVEMLLKAWLYGRFDVYNVAGKSKTTIANLARKIGEHAGGIEVAIPPSNSSGWGDAPDTVSIDTRLIEGEFPKSSWVDLDEGLKRTIEWQRILYGMV